MCHYVTIVLPADAQMAVAQATAERHHRGFEPVSNRFLAAQLRPGEQLVLTTRGQCDCGTCLGTALRPGPDHSESDLGRRIVQLRKKGWSESKIARWVEQKQHTMERNTRVMNERGDELHQNPPAGALRWIEFIRDLISSGAAAYCGVLYHWYDGRIETEKIKLRDRPHKRVSDMTPEDLLTLEEDVLYHFDAKSASNPRSAL